MLAPKPITGKQPEISIWLDDSELDKKILKKFHCVVCGGVVFEYYDSINIIIAGKHFQKAPKVILCKNRIVIDVFNSVVIAPTPGFIATEFRINRHRYKQSRCDTKYWIS